jgi:GAF domain-containing protein
VSGEVIGELVLESGQDLDIQTRELVETVAERLSVHLDNLRLAEQTRVALMETEALYGIIAEINEAGNYQEILTAICKRTHLNQASISMLCVFDQPLGNNERPEWIFPMTHHSVSDFKIAKKYPLSAFEAEAGNLFNDQIVVLDDLDTDSRLDRVARTLFRDVFKAESAIFVPLVLAEYVIGFIAGFFERKYEIHKMEIQRLLAVGGQAAIAVQSRMLLEKAQGRARQEERIRSVTTEVLSAADVDSIMRRAVEQVGRVLGRPAYIYLGQRSDRESGIRQSQGNGANKA